MYNDMLDHSPLLLSC